MSGFVRSIEELVPIRVRNTEDIPHIFTAYKYRNILVFYKYIPRSLLNCRSFDISLNWILSQSD